ncbi:MAG: hypothetical protein KDC69_11085, partial [Flavobacteriaceae bacterium]|nr:hypothetical protein [Flavobacteriaceae bacterium]
IPLQIGQKAIIETIKIPIGINLCFQVFFKETKTKITPITKTGSPIIAKNAAKVNPKAPIASKISPL